MKEYEIYRYEAYKKSNPTITGLLLFGEYSQEFFPQLSVTAMVVQDREIGEIGNDSERFVDNKRIEGSISQMLEGTLAFVRRNIKVKTMITENGTRADKSEYPIRAIREIILNALVHRDYSIHTERSLIDPFLSKMKTISVRFFSWCHPPYVLWLKDNT